MLFDYVVWFRNPAFAPDDQDYEWPACFVIEAESQAAAHEWGDRLARSHAARASETFLRSTVEFSKGDRRLPIVRVGEEASDEKIGW
jgi:hypothetical protein